MVTNHKMKETEMGYRGSKSGKLPVKEQRVDGSWFLAKIRSLRYTLMGGESRYQVKIPSKQLNSPQFRVKFYTGHVPFFGYSQNLTTLSNNNVGKFINP